MLPPTTFRNRTPRTPTPASRGVVPRTSLSSATPFRGVPYPLPVPSSSRSGSAVLAALPPSTPATPPLREITPGRRALAPMRPPNKVSSISARQKELRPLTPSLPPPVPPSRTQVPLCAYGRYTHAQKLLIELARSILGGCSRFMELQGTYDPTNEITVSLRNLTSGNLVKHAQYVYPLPKGKDRQWVIANLKSLHELLCLLQAILMSLEGIERVEVDRPASDSQSGPWSDPSDMPSAPPAAPSSDHQMSWSESSLEAPGFGRVSFPASAVQFRYYNDLRYCHAGVLKNESAAYDLIDRLLCTIGVRRKDLGLSRIPTAQVFSNAVSFYRLGDTQPINLSESNSITVPADEKLVRIDTNGNKGVGFVLVLEKLCSWTSKVQQVYDRFRRQLGPGVIVESQGYPTLSTLQFLRHLVDLFPKIKVFGIWDCDVGGARQFLNFYYGYSKTATSHLQDYRGLGLGKKLRWLGVTPTQLKAMPRRAVSKLKKAKVKEAANLLNEVKSKFKGTKVSKGAKVVIQVLTHLSTWKTKAHLNGLTQQQWVGIFESLVSRQLPEPCPPDLVYQQARMTMVDIDIVPSSPPFLLVDLETAATWCKSEKKSVEKGKKYPEPLVTSQNHTTGGNSLGKRKKR
ncbi:endodeoxyribonuclease [Apiotrichum porosum]|uniref:Endodeoxyribonuclease n=1 Tax=Apiotrichum porosum TaxID=105984 RepID=A0A427Y5X6_9TREE|nr:endodeoxyribonuclease [Apiotrichum porosum]RSH86480.1 endodeoxyribonuclease [Apiotrichum porosum]